MADPLYDLLASHLPKPSAQHGNNNTIDNDTSNKYLSRLLSLHLTDLTTTEPQSLSQANQSNLVSLQALSSRSHRTTTISSDHLTTLRDTLPSLNRSIKEVREAVPALDDSAVTFATAYSKSRDSENATLTARKDSQLLSRQADKLQDILELPTLLSAAIASAGTGTTASGANYTQALDLFAHIKRLRIIYPDSTLVKSVLVEAESAMKDMTTNLITSLRSQNIRLAAAIRTIGWLRRVVPELSQTTVPTKPKTQPTTSINFTPQSSEPQSEGTLPLLFLTARLSTFLTTTEALAPLRDLADQDTERRLAQTSSSTSTSTSTSIISSTLQAPPSSASLSRRPSGTSTSTNSSSGQQTERYLKRYIEIFREQSFNTISMYRNIFPASSIPTPADKPRESKDGNGHDNDDDKDDIISLPSSLQSFPLHLVEILMETLKTYLPNVTDLAARESLLMQVLYAANSLGRLGADFSMMISLLDVETGNRSVTTKVEESDTSETAEEGVSVDSSSPEPEWARIIKKHRVQSARLDALAAGQSQANQRESHDIAVR